MVRIKKRQHTNSATTEKPLQTSDTEEIELKQKNEGEINHPSNFCLSHSKIYTVDHFTFKLCHRQVLFIIFISSCYFYLNFFLMCNIIFMFNIRGVEPVNIQGVIYFHFEVLDMGRKTFICYNAMYDKMFGIVLLVLCGFPRVSAKTAFMPKQRKWPGGR